MLDRRRRGIMLRRMSQTQRDWLYLAAGLVAEAAIVLALRAVAISNPTTVALVLLVAVLWMATSARLWVAVVCSITAALALNYFFMPPIGTLALDEPQNWVALAVFLMVGVVARQLTVLAEARAGEALAERREAERAREKNELAVTILASLGHDLRTPLTAIGTAVENLRNADLPAPVRAEQGRVAAAEVDRLQHLVRDILDMARIDSAALTVTRDWVSPADIIDAALTGLRPSLDRRPLDVQADAASLAHVDPLLTTAALTHLVENAARYSPNGRPIELRGAVDSRGLRIAVRDHGAGLDPDEISRLFDRFYRGKAAKSAGPGAGIGLAIARGLISAQGGDLSAANAAGGGAEFELRIPSAAQAAPVGDG